MVADMAAIGLDKAAAGASAPVATGLSRAPVPVRYAVRKLPLIAGWLEVSRLPSAFCAIARPLPSTKIPGAAPDRWAAT